MATSGSVDFSVSRNDIITEALQICGVVPEGATANTNQLSDGSRTLNMLIKNLQAKPEYNLWTIQHGIVFPQADQIQYKIGGSGPDHTCKVSDFVYTTVRTAYTAGTTLEVTSTTGMTNSDFIGVVTDAGTIEWKTLTVVDSDTITLSGALTDDAAVGNYVYTYTSKLNRPLRVMSAYTKDISSDVDTNVNIISQEEYDTLSIKTTESSVPNQIYYNPQLDQGLLYMWPEPSDMRQLLYIRQIRPIEDFDGATDTPDLPQEWYLPLAWNLAGLLSTKYGVSAADKQDIKSTAMMMLMDTMSFDREGNTSIFVGIAD